MQESKEESISWERFSHVYDLMQMGNKAFRANRMEEVVHSYTPYSSILTAFVIVLMFSSTGCLNCGFWVNFVSVV